MQQLKMIRYSAPVKKRELPDGYFYRMFGGTREEIEDWIKICKNGLLPEDGGIEWYYSSIENYPDLEPERDLFFVVDADGKRVATSASVCHGDSTGYIHMVASLPETRGKGIGHAMLSFALELIENRGVTHTVLTTDDHRLAAIKTYLDAGFLPVIYNDPESDMEARWKKVLSEMKYPDVKFIYE